jgi:hypothetical protein
MSIVQNNLLSDPNYTPYCAVCTTTIRTDFDGEQFVCSKCGWRSALPEDFMKKVIEFRGLNNIHISALKGFLITSYDMDTSYIDTLLTKTLSALDHMSAIEYLLKHNSFGAMADVKATFQRMFRRMPIHYKRDLEPLSKFCHDSWSGWMRYLFSKTHLSHDGDAIIPKEFVDRWNRQMNTEYEDLPENEKESDRKEARKIIDVINRDYAYYENITKN